MGVPVKNFYVLACFSVMSAAGTIINQKNVKQEQYIAAQPFINDGSLETDSLSFYDKTTNNGSIKTKELLINGDFESTNGSLTASTVVVTASCNTFTIKKQCTIRQLNFLDVSTKIALGTNATKIISLNKGFDYMGGIECSLGRAQQGNLIITDHGKKYNFYGPSEKLEKALNEGVNTTYNVIALIAYLQRTLEQKS